MGEIADAMLSGLFCSVCGEYMDGDEPGYPRPCAGCEEREPAVEKDDAAARRRTRNRKRNEQRKRARRKQRGVR